LMPWAYRGYARDSPGKKEIASKLKTMIYVIFFSREQP